MDETTGREFPFLNSRDDGPGFRRPEHVMQAYIEKADGNIHTALKMIQAEGKYFLSEQQERDRIKREIARLQDQLTGIEKTARERQEREKRIVTQPPVRQDGSADSQEPPARQDGSADSRDQRPYLRRIPVGILDKMRDPSVFDYIPRLLADMQDKGEQIYTTIPRTGFYMSVGKTRSRRPVLISMLEMTDESVAVPNWAGNYRGYLVAPDKDMIALPDEEKFTLRKGNKMRIPGSRTGLVYQFEPWNGYVYYTNDYLGHVPEI